MPNSQAAVPYGKGIYRRRIRVVARGDRVRADLEDDFHRFGVEIRHDRKQVVEAHGDAHRFPWETCPGATARIEELAGTPLFERASELAEHSDLRVHCTHMFDIAALAIAHAAAGRDRRQYDVAVPDRHENATEPTLHRDGAPCLAWRVDGHRILGPAPFQDVRLRGRPFLEWIAAHLDRDTAEAALVLRRALYIAMGRATDLDALASAADVTPIAGASCHSMQPGVAERALRVRGSTRQWSVSGAALLSDAPESPGADG